MNFATSPLCRPMIFGVCSMMSTFRSAFIRKIRTESPCSNSLRHSDFRRLGSKKELRLRAFALSSKDEYARRGFRPIFIPTLSIRARH
jgi:hypothetical protein